MPSTPDLQTLKTEDELRTIYRRPAPGAVAKTLRHVDRHARAFIELSPFACLGTAGADGLCDVTPRGGDPGFIKVIDDTRLALPDRPGTNRLDSFTNIVSHPGVGLVFFIPGFEDTLRVNGRASISTDARLMGLFGERGKQPLSVVWIEVAEVYFHCGKAVRRSRLWDPAAQVERSTFPTMGEIYREQFRLDIEAHVLDEVFSKDARENLY